MTLCKLFLHQLFERYLQPALELGEAQVRRSSGSGITPSAVTGTPLAAVQQYLMLLRTAVDIVVCVNDSFATVVVARLSPTTTLKQVASAVDTTTATGSAHRAAGSGHTEDSMSGDGPLQHFLGRTEAVISNGLASCLACLFSIIFTIIINSNSSSDHICVVDSDHGRSAGGAT